MAGYASITAGPYTGDRIVNQGVIDETGGAGSLVVDAYAFTNNGTIDAATAAPHSASIRRPSPTMARSTSPTGDDLYRTDDLHQPPLAHADRRNLRGRGRLDAAGRRLPLDNHPQRRCDPQRGRLAIHRSVYGFKRNAGARHPVAHHRRLGRAAASFWPQPYARQRGDRQQRNDPARRRDAELDRGELIADGWRRLELLGFGTVTATTFANSGTIEAKGGTLTLTNAVTGTGGLQIDANATLVLASSTATTDSATFNGAGATLKLNHTGNLSGAIGEIGLDDGITLVGVTANSASVNGSNQLVVTESGTTVATLNCRGPMPVSISSPRRSAAARRSSRCRSRRRSPTISTFPRSTTRSPAASRFRTPRHRSRRT